MIDLKEVIVANAFTMIAMWFLLDCRRKNRESAHADDKLYDGMCAANLAGALLETIAFTVDGKMFFGSIAINYLANSLCFLGTVTIGFLWAIYVNLRIYQNFQRANRAVKIAIIPWAIEVVAIVSNLFGTGFLFTVSDANVYQRGTGAVIGYISLMLYFAYSLFLEHRSQKQGFDLHFFPVLYFVAPCLAGVIAQFCFYGITTSWISVATALVFVQMQTYAENLYKDELSGLFNRRYLDRMIKKRTSVDNATLFGIMLDINGFKDINDSFGHNVGDTAIRVLGDVLFRSIPDGAMALRYAGDEFIVLLPDTTEDEAVSTMDAIRSALDLFNESGVEPFELHAAMGHARLEPADSEEDFLRRMDRLMYAEKRAFHRDE